MDKSKKISDKELIYQLEGKPSFKVAFPLGLQHVLAMFTGNLAPILILIGVLKLDGSLSVKMIQCAMFVSGLTTFVQLYPIKIGKFQIGAGLPIVMGTSFAFVPTAKTVGMQFGLAGLLGSAALGSLVEVIMGFFYKPLKKLFPPLVVGSVLITIGIKLLDVGVSYFAGGAAAASKGEYGSIQNLTLGFLVFFPYRKLPLPKQCSHPRMRRNFRHPPSEDSDISEKGADRREASSSLTGEKQPLLSSSKSMRQEALELCLSNLWDAPFSALRSSVLFPACSRAVSLRMTELKEPASCQEVCACKKQNPPKLPYRSEEMSKQVFSTADPWLLQLFRPASLLFCRKF